jgi:hypothetical protein
MKSTPKRISWQASARPVGPAPTIKTSVCIDAFYAQLSHIENEEVFDFTISFLLRHVARRKLCVLGAKNSAVYFCFDIFLNV